jgi:hypothetical protein
MAAKELKIGFSLAMVGFLYKEKGGRNLLLYSVSVKSIANWLPPGRACVPFLFTNDKDNVLKHNEIKMKCFFKIMLLKLGLQHRRGRRSLPKV